MKKILLIALLIAPCLGFAQTTKPVTGVLGIKFGTSKADFIAAMKSKGATQLQSNKDTDRLDFKDITIGQRTAIHLIAWFINDQLCETAFYFKAEVDDKTIDYYNGLVDDISNVYGPGKPTKDFRGNYTDGDGYEITGIQKGDVNFYTDWTDTSTGNMIEASIMVKLYIKLIYVDDALNKVAKAAQNAKDSSQY